MRKLILPLMLGLALASCSRDGGNGVENIIIPTPVETPILPTKVINVEEDGSTEISTFTYNGDRVVEFTSGYAGGWNAREKWYYNAQGLLEKVESNENRGTNEEAIFTYDNQNRLIKYVKKSVSTSSSDPNNQNVVTYITTRLISYVGNTITIQETKETTNSILTQFNGSETTTIVHTLENGVKMKSVEEDAYKITTTTYEYDDKNGVMKNVKGVDSVALLEISTTLGVKHNPVYVKSVERVKSSGDETIRETRNVLEYNANGYPKKITSTRTDSNSFTGPQVETREFEYNK